MSETTLKELQDQLARNIRTIRAYRGLTRKQVADKARITPETLGKYERGTVNMLARKIVAVAFALDVPPAMLLADWQIPTTTPPTGEGEES